jgi:hypothetical protein
MTTKIISVEMADYDDSTVSVTVDREVGPYVFDVQTTDMEYRSDLGCWITDGTNIAKGGEDISYDDYPDVDFGAVISAAEGFINNRTQVVRTGYSLEYGDQICLLDDGEDVKVVVENKGFVNSATSSYQRQYGDPVAIFENQEEAMKWLEKTDMREIAEADGSGEMIKKTKKKEKAMSM